MAVTTEVKEDQIMLRNRDTGWTVSVPQRAAHNTSYLRRRVRAEDVQAVVTEGEIEIDVERRTYRMPRYPPLGWMLGMRLYVVLGALLLAAGSQVQFYLPCGSSSQSVTVGSSDYCVPTAMMANVTSTVCPLTICEARVPVTMQTYVVLLNGALAGKTGALATALYVLAVCLGAPFGAGAKVDPIWARGAILGSTGGYFLGFIIASWIMGVCAERGHDRPRSVYYMIPWMFLAEVAMYVCGLIWLPFGIAVRKRVHPGWICPYAAGTDACVQNVLKWGLTPFIPGDLVKMLLVLLTVPALWQASLWWHQRRGGHKPLLGIGLPDDEEDAALVAGEEGGAVRRGSAEDELSPLQVTGLGSIERAGGDASVEGVIVTKQAPAQEPAQGAQA
jgi:biotin transport system substrate-specific component